MKKELYLDAFSGFLVGLLVGLAVIAFSRIGFDLGTGGIFEQPMDILLSQEVPITLNWSKIFKFIAVFGLIFAFLNPFYTYVKKVIRQQMHKNQPKTKKK